MTVLHGTKTKIMDQLIAFHKIMHDHGDQGNSRKLVELYQKNSAQEFVISFAGHFSAGKSSMINALLEKDILPKSPIPTSANIVKISSGKGVAQVYFNHDEPVEYDEPYDMDMIKEFCKDKDTIQRIELSTGEPLIPHGCSIIDTPGIDAADDADRVITESSLHLVDVLFYVMDYNHVQSEVNLYFLKSIQEMGIPYYIIINQVDKHDEKEILFKDYERNIKQTFDQWNLTPMDLYFSSLIDENAPHNQFNQIKEKLSQQFSHYQTFIRTSGALQQIIKTHRKFLEQSFDEQKNQFESFTDYTNLKNRLKEIHETMEAEQEKTKQLENDFQNEIQSTLKNAYLMPANLRELAGNFLESRQNDFKIGIIGSKKKTEQEKEMRMNAFLSELQKSIEVNIQWKLREKINRLLHESDIRDRTITEIIPNFTTTYTESDLLGHIKTGAKVNGDYILNYTNDISTDIKTKFKQQARSLWLEINAVMEKEIEETLINLQNEQKQLEQSLRETENYKAILDDYQNKLQRLNQSMEVTDNARELMNSKLEENQRKPRKDKLKKINKSQNQVKNKRKDISSSDLISDAHTITSIHSLIDQTIQAVEDLPGFDTLINDLKEKQNRLVNRTLTIALFGAFSAGKSSFANALLGDHVLPVSPNPTTAVINRINPVTNEYPHGTVVIQLKNEESIIRDIKSITKHIAAPVDNLAKLINWINRDKIYNSSQLNYLFQNYLLALSKGYDKHRELLGSDIVIPLENFASYVTDEKIACYVEAIDLYYDCSLTQQGITLVDTPGADSINARHTNVAFDYIKSADAILYVSYYNHALSRADKDFLMQLGRVKESFELDKMFFIINAADLAESDADLKLVSNYVEDQLLQLGIRFPKIFPLSSKLSLEEKRSQQLLNDHMATFEDDLYDFINNGLTALTMEAALYDMKRIKQSLTHFIETASLDEQEKNHFKQNLNHMKSQLLEVTSDFNGDLYKDRLTEKIQKQLHYVEERMSIRFHDMFKEMFNPTTVTESGKKAVGQLERNLNSLLDYVGFELLQEVRAVSLRMEAQMNELLKMVYEELEKKIAQVDTKLLLPGLYQVEYHTPEYEQALADIEVRKFTKALSLYKGTKSFFVKNEKEKMKEEIYLVLNPEIKAYLAHTDSLMKHAYTNQWTKAVENMKSRITDRILTYIEDHFSLMEDTIEVKILQERKQILDTILQ